MEEFKSKYVAHTPDDKGFIQYSAKENKVWSILFERQMKLLPGRACDEFIAGLEHLQLSADAIPQLPDVNARMHAKTG